MKNLKIKKALKTMILLGSSLVLIPNIGCSEAETIEVVEVVDNTNELTATPVITVAPTIEPTATPEPTEEPTATPKPIPTMIPEPADEDKKYCDDLTEEDLLLIEEQLKDFYDDIIKNEQLQMFFMAERYCFEDIINSMYLMNNREIKYENCKVDCIENAIVFIPYLNIVLYYNNGLDNIITSYFPKDTEEYRLANNMEVEFKEIIERGDIDSKKEYFNWCKKLCSGEEVDGFSNNTLSLYGIMMYTSLMRSQLKTFDDDFDKDYSDNMLKIFDNAWEEAYLYLGYGDMGQGYKIKGRTKKDFD